MKISECRKGDTFNYIKKGISNPITLTLIDTPSPLTLITCEKRIKGIEEVYSWVTTPKDFIYPESPCSYGYTNASVEVFAKDLEVNVLHNLYDLGEEKRNEIYSMLNRREK